MSTATLTRRIVSRLAPPAHESAWYAGFCLGIDWIEADAPSHFSPFCQLAWQAGYEQGRTEAERERDEAFAFLDARELPEYERWEEAELCRVNRVPCFV